MSEFKDAIAWRGPNRLGFIVYGIWDSKRIGAALAREVADELAVVLSGSRVSPFIAADEGWPCDVSVFDVEFSDWPADPGSICSSLLAKVCGRGARLSWMMFDGMFNDVWELFSAEWASHVYAIRGDCRVHHVELAIEDDARHSPAWREVVLGYRRKLIEEYPPLAKT